MLFEELKCLHPIHFLTLAEIILCDLYVLGTIHIQNMEYLRLYFRRIFVLSLLKNKIWTFSNLMFRQYKI